MPPPNYFRGAETITELGVDDLQDPMRAMMDLIAEEVIQDLEAEYRSYGTNNPQVRGVQISVDMTYNIRALNTNEYNDARATEPTLFSAAASLLGFLPRVRLDDLPDDSKACFVCHEHFPGPDSRNPDTPILLRCNHIVGRACIEQWILGGHNSCPLCRAAIFEPAGSRIEQGAPLT